MKRMFGSLMIISMLFLVVLSCNKLRSDRPVPPRYQHESNALKLNKSVLGVGQLSVATAQSPIPIAFKSFKWEVRNSAGIVQPQIGRLVRYQDSVGAKISGSRKVMNWSPAAPGFYTISFEGRYDQGKTVRYVKKVTVKPCDVGYSLWGDTRNDVKDGEEFLTFKSGLKPGRKEVNADRIWYSRDGLHNGYMFENNKLKSVIVSTVFTSDYDSNVRSKDLGLLRGLVDEKVKRVAKEHAAGGMPVKSIGTEFACPPVDTDVREYLPFAREKGGCKAGRDFETATSRGNLSVKTVRMPSHTSLVLMQQYTRK